MADLPGGTVTFLFTDIEGSTRLLQQAGEAYANILADHHRLLRATFEDHGGTEVDTQGDAFFVSFPRAHDAVMAAAQAQRALSEHSWPGGLTVKVRMGLHTGEPLVSDSGYIGMDVHRAARIAHAGHGGQVLLSPSTTALVDNDLPEQLSLKDLGSHRLKDLPLPITIHQLVIAGLEGKFPPLRSLESRPNNLPVPLTPFVGRAEEIDQVTQLLSDSRLVTVVGPGGTGKTRLCLELAGRLLEEYEDGAWFIELDAIESADDLVLTIAPAMRFAIDAHSSDLDPERQLLDFLSNRSLLLVMDNFEHLLPGASLLTRILAEAPQVKVIVTSREQLNVEAEWAYPLAGMSYPANGKGRPYQTYSGVALFIERARQVKPDFEPTEDMLKTIAEICKLVDGLPLAIELAAAWIGMLSCHEVAAEIQQGIDFLASSRRDIPDRQKSIRAVYDRSWTLLPGELQAGLRRLAVFKGGFERDAASEICDVTLQVLLGLTRKSLLQRNDAGRFEMHPLLKSYADEKLGNDVDEQRALREAHSRYFIHFLEDRQDDIQGERFEELRSEVRTELANVRWGMSWALEQWNEDEARSAVQSYCAYALTEGFANTTTYFRRMADQLRAAGASIEPDAPRQTVLLTLLAYVLYGAISLGDPEADTMLGNCIPVLREMDLPVELGIALQAQGIQLEYLGQYAESIEVLKESLALLVGSPEVFLTVSCQTWLGWAFYELGDYDQAGEVFQQAHRLCLASGNIMGLPYALSKLGTWADARQEYQQGLEYHRQAQKYFTAIGDQSGQGYALSRMSFSAWGMGEYQDALKYGIAGYDKFSPLGHRWGTATSLCRIGFAEVDLGRLDEARGHFQEALLRAKAGNIPTTFNYGLIGLGAIWLHEGKLDRSAAILLHTAKDPSTPGLYRDIASRYLLGLESQLGPARLQELTAKAASTTLEEWLLENLELEPALPS